MSPTSRQAVRAEVMQSLDGALDTLYALWEEIGIEEDQAGKRAGTVAMHLCNLIQEMVSEEQQLRDELALNIQRSLAQLSTLCLEMGLPPFHGNRDLSMVQREKELTTKLASVQRERQERMDKLHHLMQEDEALCQELCATPYYLPHHAVPARSQLLQLDAHVKELRMEKEKRYQEMLTTKQKVLALCRELEHQAETSFEKDVMCDGDNAAIQLTKEQLTALHTLHHNLEKKKTDLEQQCKDLWQRIHALWDRIDLPDSHRSEFTARHQGATEGVVCSLRLEVARCEDMKHGNLRRFIEGVRREISHWWDRCYFSQAQRDAFQHFHTEEFTEEMLEAHEEEVKRLQDYHTRHLTLLALLDKRHVLWAEMVQFEKAASDPTRFFNDRGGKFLKEEKARTKLMKQLPRIEEDIKREVEAWETHHGQQFLVEGVTYQQYVDQQWSQLRHHKEQQKQDRHKSRAKQTEEEMIYGSKPTPNTPVKRRFNATTNRTPLKSRKDRENGGTPSSSRTPQSRPPLTAVKTNNVMNTMRRRSVRQARKHLRESLQKKRQGPVHKAKRKSANTAARPELFSRTMKGLNQTARPNCRSSVAPHPASSPVRPR